MIYCQMQRFFNNVQSDIYPPTNFPITYISGDIYPFVFLYALCGTPTMLIKKEYFESVGGFATNLPSFEDYEFSIRFSKEYEVLLYNEPLVNVYQTNNSINDQFDSHICVQCFIMDKYRDSLETYGLKELKMQRVWEEAIYYNNLDLLKEKVLPLLEDVKYAKAFSKLNLEQTKKDLIKETNKK